MRHIKRTIVASDLNEDEKVFSEQFKTHIWMSYVIYERVMSHVWRSHVYTWMSRVSHVNDVSHTLQLTHMNESRHIWTSHVTCMRESCLHMNGSCLICEPCKSHTADMTWMNHDSQMNHEWIMTHRWTWMIHSGVNMTWMIHSCVNMTWMIHSCVNMSHR